MIADLGLTDGDRDAAALILAAMRRDDEGLRAVAIGPLVAWSSGA